MWLNYVNQQRQSFKNTIIRVALAADVDDVPLRAANQSVEFIRPPTTTPDNFPDFWDPQHFGWKTWLWKYNVDNSPNYVMLYSDAGSAMIQFPVDAVNIALRDGVCIYEDSTQLNKYWCQRTFCEALQVIPEELEMVQPLAGFMAAWTGSSVAQKLFSSIWDAAQKRDVLAGPKWEGVLPSGQPFGHRHDQSILAILGRRHAPASAWREMNLDICSQSAHKTFISNCSYYLHRGNFIGNSPPFVQGITDAFVINLERRQDRLEKFRKTHASFAEVVERWPAVDGRTLTLTPALARLFKPNDFFWKKAVMGCALSHLGLWWRLANDPNPAASYLIFEDDARCYTTAAFKDSMAAAMLVAPADYDVLYLGGCLPPNKHGLRALAEPVAPADPSNPWRRIAANQLFGQRIPTRYYHFCAYGYVLSKRGAEKLMKLIKDRGGYYTSADHMMCNQVDTFKLYFLNEQPVGCIQEDDERYLKAEFNNFSRIDNFDSDLWTNDERFSKEDVASAAVATAADAQADCQQALADAAAASRRQVKSQQQSQQQQQAQPTFLTLLIDPKATPPSFSTYLEVDWLSYVLGINLRNTPLVNIASLPLGHKFPIPPICIVQRSHIAAWKMIFDYWKKSGQEFYAVHLSD